MTLTADVQMGSVNRWIAALPPILFAGNGSWKHRQVVKLLLKQRNQILVQSLPQNFNYFDLMKEN
jgi:hypothetical protein